MGTSVQINLLKFSPVPKLRKSPTKKMFKKTKKKLRKKRPRSEISSSQEIPFPAAGNTSDLTPEEPDVIPTKKSKSKKRRCACCKKKLTLAEGVECRCGMLLCGLHRYTDKHECTFDFKTEDRKILTKNNQKCVDDKVTRI